MECPKREPGGRAGGGKKSNSKSFSHQLFDSHVGLIEKRRTASGSVSLSGESRFAGKKVAIYFVILSFSPYLLSHVSASEVEGIP